MTGSSPLGGPAPLSRATTTKDMGQGTQGTPSPPSPGTRDYLRYGWRKNWRGGIPLEPRTETAQPGSWVFWELTLVHILIFDFLV